MLQHNSSSPQSEKDEEEHFKYLDDALHWLNTCSFGFVAEDGWGYQGLKMDEKKFKVAIDTPCLINVIKLAWLSTRLWMESGFRRMRGKDATASAVDLLAIFCVLVSCGEKKTRVCVGERCESHCESWPVSCWYKLKHSSLHPFSSFLFEPKNPRARTSTMTESWPLCPP